MYKVISIVLLGVYAVSAGPLAAAVESDSPCHRVVVGPGGTTLADTSSSDVAFSCGLSHTLKVTNGDTIQFDRIFTNIGNGYNALSGVFTTPRSGVYIFHLHAYDMNKDKAMWLEVVKNQEMLVSISGYDSHSTAGNTVMTFLNKGDRVFIRSRPGQEFSLFGQNDEIYATFTGYKVSDVKHRNDAPSSNVQDPFQFLPGGRR